MDWYCDVGDKTINIRSKENIFKLKLTMHSVNV